MRSSVEMIFFLVKMGMTNKAVSTALKIDLCLTDKWNVIT